jgi:hypothetical protein
VSIVDRLVEEVVLFTAAALRRLDLLDTKVEVILGGGVLVNAAGYLLDRVAAGCARVAPHAVPRVVTVPPVVGAALLGLDALGCGPAAESRLRETFPPE